MRNDTYEEGQRWLAQAKEDLRWAKHLAEEGAGHLACFLVTEMALKAFLYAQGEDIVVGHSVARLCAAAAEYRSEFNDKKPQWSTRRELHSYQIS